MTQSRLRWPAIHKEDDAMSSKPYPHSWLTRPGAHWLRRELAYNKPTLKKPRRYKSLPGQRVIALPANEESAALRGKCPECQAELVATSDKYAICPDCNGRLHERTSG
jgi:hypothetical protein